MSHLTSCFEKDNSMTKAVNRFSSTFNEISKYDTIFNEQITKTIYESLHNFLQDFDKVKESKKNFEKRSDDLDLYYNRYMQISKLKTPEWEDAKKLLISHRVCFQHVSLDYVAQMSLLSSRKSHVILDSVRPNFFRIFFSFSYRFFIYLSFHL